MRDAIHTLLDFFFGKGHRIHWRERLCLPVSVKVGGLGVVFVVARELLL